ncbi:MAG: TCP-1/cpn60 chaperonin family protein, partial [Halobacteriota archaeon]
LVENSGGDPLDKLVELRSAHESGDKNAGIAADGEVRDMLALNVIDPLRVKLNAVESATEAANMILRIDDIIAAGGEQPDLGGEGPGMY